MVNVISQKIFLLRFLQRRGQSGHFRFQMGKEMGHVDSARQGVVGRQGHGQGARSPSSRYLPHEMRGLLSAGWGTGWVSAV